MVKDVQGLKLYEKETPTQVFSSESYKIFKNTYFEEHLPTDASRSRIIRETDSSPLDAYGHGSLYMPNRRKITRDVLECVVRDVVSLTQ